MNRKQPLAIPSQRTVEELQVFLRAMSAAQRRWGKALAQQENRVRRLMMVEDHCREELKRNVLRSTHKNLKYLVNTDLLTTARQAPTPPPAETFLFYDIPAQQVSAFSVYAMSRLWADPERVDVPPVTLIADLQSSWAILPPAKRAAYEQLADIFRAHLDAEYTRRAAATAAAPSGKAVKARQASQRIKAARKRASQHSASASGSGTRRKGEEVVSKALAPATATPTTKPLLASSSSSSLVSWEASAFDRFAKVSRQHMLAALHGGGRGKGRHRLSPQEWLPIAQAEWATKSTRQKRCFLPENRP